MKCLIFKDSEKTIFFILSLLILFYLVLRAIFVPILHDEVSTFFAYVQTGKFLPFQSITASNNHFLNSALTTFFYEMFGSSKFVLRLSNVLSIPLLIYFTYKLGWLIKNKILRWTFVLSVLMAHNFIEFMALSRGYGMSMAFLQGSIYYIILLFRSGKIKYVLLCLLLSTLAISANLTLIVSGLIIIFLLLLRLIIASKEYGSKKIIQYIMTVLFMGMIPLIFFVWISFEYKARGLLVHGTNDGFWEITVNSIIVLITGKNYSFVSYTIILYFIGMIGVFIYALLRNRSIKILIDSNLTFFWILMGNIIASILLSKLFGINFPQDRTGLYFYPLFVGGIVFMTDMLLEKFRYRYILIVLFPLLFMCFHFLLHINLKYVSNHKYSTLPERFYDSIESTWKPNTSPPTVSAHGLQTACWDYLNFRKRGLMNQIQSTVFPSNLTDFQISHLAYFPQLIEEYEIIDYEESIYQGLFKRKNGFTKGSLNN